MDVNLAAPLRLSLVRCHCITRAMPHRLFEIQRGSVDGLRDLFEDFAGPELRIPGTQRRAAARGVRDSPFRGGSLLAGSSPWSVVGV
jgi:hypothetical protein